MDYYKELIGDIYDCLIAQPSEAVCKRVLREAADAIERLYTDVARLEAENRAKEQYIAETIGKVIKERDEWKTLGSLANKRAEDYREMRRQRDKAIKERDAAVADLTVFDKCKICKHYNERSANYGYTEFCENCGAYPWADDEEPNKWEWRGVLDEC